MREERGENCLKTPVIFFHAWSWAFLLPGDYEGGSGFKNATLATMGVVKTPNFKYCKIKSQILSTLVSRLLREELQSLYSFKNSSSSHNGENEGKNSWD